MAQSTTSTVANRLETIDQKDLLIAFIIALFPAFGAYMIVSITLSEATVGVLVLGLVVFTWAFYQKPGVKPKIGAGLFWLAIEAFAAPIAILGFSIAYTSEQTGALEQFGAAIGGILMFFFTWMVAWFAGIILYLISRRFERSDQKTT